MPASSTPRTTTIAKKRRALLGVRVIGVAVAMTAAIVVTAPSNGSAVALTAAGGIDIAPGISVDPAPGWSVGDQSPGSITLHNVFSSAIMEITVKPAKGTDPVAVLQADINNLGNTSRTGLTNVKNLSAPTTTPVQGNFQQEASIDYAADGSSQLGPLPVIGSFIELLNTSNHQSAFIVFVQNGDATSNVDNDGGAMVNSLL